MSHVSETDEVMDPRDWHPGVGRGFPFVCLQSKGVGEKGQLLLFCATTTTTTTTIVIIIIIVIINHGIVLERRELSQQEIKSIR